MDHTVQGILQARILELVAIPISGVSSQPRDQTQVSRIAGRFFTSWATREAQEYWSGQPIPSPADLLQQIFPTQELNRGLLHFRWILYQLSYQGSPKTPEDTVNYKTLQAHQPLLSPKVTQLGEEELGSHGSHLSIKPKHLSSDMSTWFLYKLSQTRFIGICNSAHFFR